MLVGAVLAPQCAHDAELGEGRRPPDHPDKSLVLVGSESVLGDERGGDRRVARARANSHGCRRPSRSPKTRPKPPRSTCVSIRARRHRARRPCSWGRNRSSRAASPALATSCHTSGNGAIDRPAPAPCARHRASRGARGSAPHRAARSIHPRSDSASRRWAYRLVRVGPPSASALAGIQAETRSSMDRNIASPSGRPSAGSQARSGCGIIPSTLPLSLTTPAISRTEPFGLAPAASAPSAPT